MKKHDEVNHPKHYTSHPSGVECISIVRHMNFDLGNAFKYVFRRNLKRSAVTDLRKALFYLNDEAARSTHMPTFDLGAIELLKKVIKAEEDVDVKIIYTEFMRYYHTDREYYLCRLIKKLETFLKKQEKLSF